MDFRVLMQKAKAETITDREIDAVAAALRSGAAPDQVYRQVYILGRSFARRYESLIAHFLVCPDEPEVSAAALSILCAQWKLGRKYRGYLLAGMFGLSWDVDGDVLIRALSSAGSYLRENSDGEVLVELIGVADGNRERIVSERAWEAVAIALGDSYGEARPRRDPQENAEWISSLRERVTKRLEAESVSGDLRHRTGSAGSDP